MPLAAMLMVLAAPAILLSYGEDYVGGALTVLILAPYLFIRPTGVMSSHILSAMAQQALMFKVNIVSVAINVTMSILLVPAIGIEGAALAATVGFAINSVLMYHYANEKIGVQLDHGAQTRMVAGSAMAMVIAATVFLGTGFLGLGFLILFARLAAATLLGLGVYLLYIRKVGFFTEEEMENVRSVAKHSKLASLILRLIGH
jgi:O-antigen/teichoic acid export membrane protein